MSTWSPFGDNLIFVLSPPRSGSTMLRVMLESHSRIQGSIEPHIMVPLRYAGYFGKPKVADYDHVNASSALRQFVQKLPAGEADYLDACRAYAGVLYERKLSQKSGATYFMDKTPENTLEWPFVTRVFPRAKYVVLTRNPLAILYSTATSFFGGDFELAAREYPLLKLYIPKIARFLEEAPVSNYLVAYEQIVSNPQETMGALLDWLDLPYEDAVVHFGKVDHERARDDDMTRSLKHGRPSTASIEKWMVAVKHDPAFAGIAARAIHEVADADWQRYGYEKASLLASIDAAAEMNVKRPTRKSGSASHRFKIKAYHRIRPIARRPNVRRLLEGLRYYCDVLLREHPSDVEEHVSGPRGRRTSSAGGTSSPEI